MLRGERDKYVNGLIVIMYIFQLTRSVGSVTLKGGSKYSREETVLTARERVEEVARMLAGISISDNTRAVAQEMLRGGGHES